MRGSSVANQNRLRPVFKWVAIVVAMVVGAGGLFALAGLPVYVYPPQDQVDRADLIYVIGPVTKYRVRMERILREEGIAGESLYSVPLTGFQSAAELAACKEPAVTCVHPEPFTTKGEALALGDFAARNGISGQVVVLTRTAHVARTRFIFDKCYDGEVAVIGVNDHITRLEWAQEYVYQTAAFVKAWITPCDDPSGF